MDANKLNVQIKSLITMLLVAACVLLFTVGCENKSGSQNTTPSQKPEKGRQHVSFRLKWLVYSGFGPQLLALEQGYFERAGVKVDIQPGGPGLDPIKLVVTGAEDVGLASYDQILIAREKGIPVIAIAEDTTKSGVGFTALKTSGIREPKDFVGKRVGIMPGTDKGTIYEALMAKLGINRAKITEIPVTFNMDVLLNGTVDVFPSFITNQPILAKEKGYEVTVIDPYEYGIRPGGNVVFTSEETLLRKRDALKRFLTGELQAIIASHKVDDAMVVDAVLKHNAKLNRAAELKIWRASRDMLYEADSKKVGFMEPETWSHTADLSKRYGLIKVIPALNKCYTNELVKEIHAEGSLNSAGTP